MGVFFVVSPHETLSAIAGLVLIEKPFDTLVVFTLIFGAWFVVAGVVRFVAALASPEGRGGNIITAILNLIAGIVTCAGRISACRRSP